MGRSPCCEKAHTNKGAWTKEEDDRLIAYIRAHGEGCWLKEEIKDQKISMNNNNNPSNGIFDEKKSNPVVQERCPDLNLDLRISPPYHQTQAPEPLKTGGRTLCFSCSLGVKNSKECSCSSFGATAGSSSSNTNSGYDFLGLKSGFLDYRSLEMK
ncbi:hypothetical protein COLO4_17321 [Corchorus olitorius]|uniref:Uncharacterized protein n=1 Tax=Corchorus olitorius TaxID=93759 RepID=A0A1R3JD66_9ROSI|nr:hypothetical protein COLO4_17321 [Corchorus olitorius]